MATRNPKQTDKLAAPATKRSCCCLSKQTGPMRNAEEKREHAAVGLAWSNATKAAEQNGSRLYKGPWSAVLKRIWSPRGSGMDRLHEAGGDKCGPQRARRHAIRMTKEKQLQLKLCCTCELMGNNDAEEKQHNDFQEGPQSGVGRSWRRCSWR